MGRATLFGQPAVQVALRAGVVSFLVSEAVLQSPIYADDLLYYYRGVKTAPDNEGTKINLANVLGERGHYDEAITLYDQVLARNPVSWSANFNLGHFYYQMGKLDEAESYLRRAVALNPSRSDQYLFLGPTYFKKDRLEAAATALREAIRLNPQASGYHFALGMVLKLQGNFTGAIEEFKSELVVDPEQKAAKEQTAEIENRLHQTRK